MADTFGLLQEEQLIQCATILEEMNAVLLTTVLRDIQYGAEEKVAMKVWLALSRQILHWMPVMSMQQWNSIDIVLINIPDFKFLEVSDIFLEIVTIGEDEKRVA